MVPARAMKRRSPRLSRGGLGVVAEDVRLHTGITGTAPYAMGSRGTRGGAVGGSVLLLAGEALQRKVCAI
ncbi:MAG: hypothetical protein QOF70_7972 [Acetobacteraceae bacterium]|jgi:hypothetical protein|nr:hypothetical protein [Acetobacteraceae bacterium]